MWKLLGFITLAVFGISAQEAEITCDFRFAQVLQTNDYGCVLDRQEFNLSSQDAEISVAGGHASGFADEDVRVLQISFSSFNRFPALIFERFPNIEAIEISNCGSFEFNSSFIAATHLLQARIVYNFIPVLPQGAFPENLEYLILYHNELQDLGDAPFWGLTNLWHISLADNEIRELLPNQLATLNSLRSFYINNNTIEHLDNDLFTENHVLVNAHFEDNRISSIGEQFLDNVAESIQFLGLQGNVCVNENFGIDNLTTLEVVREAIQGCTNPQSPQPNDRFTFELHGNLTIFDQDGNELLRINN